MVCGLTPPSFDFLSVDGPILGFGRTGFAGFLLPLT